MALKTFNVGDILAAADVNQFCVNTQFATKNSTTSRSSAPGFADDPDLQLPIIASARYRLLLMVVFDSPSAAGFQFTFTGSGSNNLYGMYMNWNPSGAIGTATYDGGFTNDLTSTMVLGGTASSGVTNWLKVDGILKTGPSSGTLTFRWAQQNSNASNTNVRTGSSLSLWQVS